MVISPQKVADGEVCVTVYYIMQLIYVVWGLAVVEEEQEDKVPYIWRTGFYQLFQDVIAVKHVDQINIRLGETKED
jgi:hypothetical protein